MDFSWSEMMLVGIVALIVIGPKDLPGMFRELGRFTAKLRSMGREFSRAMEQAAKESGVKDVANDLKAVANPKSMGLDAVKSAADKFEKWDPMKPAAKPQAPVAAAVATPSVVAPVEQAVAAPAVLPVTPTFGPATAALAEKQAAKKAVAAETVEKLKTKKIQKVPPVAPPAPAAAVADAGLDAVAPAKPRGRVRKTAPTAGSETA